MATLLTSSAFVGGIGLVGATPADTTTPKEISHSQIGETTGKAASAGTTAVELVPSDTELKTGDTQEFEIVVADASSGVGAITAELTTNSDIARIESASFRGDPGVQNITISDNGGTANLRAALLEIEDNGRVTVGTVTIAGVGPGETTTDLAVPALGNETGEPYEVGATLGTAVTVKEATEAVPLAITANRSQTNVGELIKFAVTRADSDVRVDATVVTGSQTVATGVDGTATIRVTEAMIADGNTLTAVATKERADSTTFLNDSTTLSVGEINSDGSEQTTVRLTPITATTGVDENVTVDIVVEQAPRGVGAFRARISVGEAAQITGVNLTADPGIQNVTIGPAGRQVVIKAALRETTAEGRVTIGTVTLTGVSLGQSPIDLTMDALGDRNGQAYTVTATPASSLKVKSGGEVPTNETSSSQGASSGSTVILSLDRLPNGFQRAGIVIETAMPATVTEIHPEVVNEKQTRVLTRADSSTRTHVQLVDLAGAVNPTNQTQDLLRLSFDRNLTRTDLTVRAESLQNDNEETMSRERLSVRLLTDQPFSRAIPGSAGEGPPTDPDGDGMYEDVNGDETVDFDDAVALAFVDTSSLSQTQVAALDFDDDGDLDIDDAIALAFEP